MKLENLSFGELILELRKQRGWSRSYVAKQIGRTQQSVLTMEREYNIPRVDAIVKFAKLYQMPLELLTQKATELYIAKHAKKPFKRLMGDRKPKDGPRFKKKKREPLFEVIGFGDMLESIKEIAPASMMPPDWGKIG